MLKITQNLQTIKDRIANAETLYNREPGSVTLVGITTKRPMGLLKTAADEGLTHFGEGHLQEAIAKATRLKSYQIQWHFLEAVQQNKAQAIAQFFDWVHSIERAKTAVTLSEERPDHLPPINILLDVNVDDEPNKSGVAFEELPMIFDFVKKLPRVKLRGLTCSPKARHEFEAQREPFKRMKEAFEKLKQNGHPELDTLCMGRSRDFEAAIAEGSTMVMIGVGIFGELN